MKPLVLAFVCILLVSSTAFGRTFYFSHVANGVLGANTVWKTTIFLTNPAAAGTTPASGTITFMQDNPGDPTAAGTPFAIGFMDETGAPAGGNGAIGFQIAGSQTKKFTSTGGGAYAGGFAVVTSTGPVDGTAIFSEFNGAGTLIGEAGVPAADAFNNQAIFVDTMNGYNIGVAFANPGTTTANITLKLVDATANAIATVSETLGASNHYAHFVSELFPSAPPLAGTMQIISDIRIPAIALRFDPSFSVFTTLPPVRIASLLLSQPMNALARLLTALHNESFFAM